MIGNLSPQTRTRAGSLIRRAFRRLSARTFAGVVVVDAVVVTALLMSPSSATLIATAAATQVVLLKRHHMTIDGSDQDVRPARRRSCDPGAPGSRTRSRPRRAGLGIAVPPGPHRAAAVVLAMLAVGVSFHAGGSARVPRRHPNVHQDQRERLTQNGAQRSASRVGLDNVHVHVHVHVQRGWHRTDRDPLILVIVDHQDGRRLPRLA